MRDVLAGECGASTWTLHVGDATKRLRRLDDQSVHCIVCSPPYWGLRDYDAEWQIGLEETPEEYVAKLVAVFREARRVLRDDGVLWLNLGDTYVRDPAKGGLGPGGKHAGTPDYPKARARMSRPGEKRRAVGMKPKDLAGIPWMVAFALRDDGWYLRGDTVWAKVNPLPESVRDRFTRSHEFVFMFAKQPLYYFDADAVKEAQQTDPSERYNSRSRVVGRGQGYAAARGGDRSQSGGFPVDSSRRNRRDVAFAPDHDALLAWLGQNHPAIARQYLDAAGASDVWSITAQPYGGTHRATFPAELVRPCVLSSSSSHGVCRWCGAPWRRVTAKRAIGRSALARLSFDPLTKPFVDDGLDSVVATVGWRPTCRCYDAHYVADFARARSRRKRGQQDACGSWRERVLKRPGSAGWSVARPVVLDVFSGAATTGVVAIEEGRNYVGIELNRAWAEESAARLRKTQRECSTPLLDAVEGLSQKTLFEG